MTASNRDEDLRRAAERLLRAASAAESVSPSPFFKKRVLSQLRAIQTDRRAFGFFAWRSLPAALMVTLLLLGWTAYESSLTERTRKEALSSMMTPPAAGADVFLVAALFAPDTGPGGEKP